MIAVRILCLAIGYVFGLFQTAYIYGRSKGIDIRKEGSGNAGTTNSLRVFGWKAAFLTFLGDFLKAILAVLLVSVVFSRILPDFVKVLELYAGFGAVLGHNFPCYLKFKGGKGIACTAGVILAIYPPVAVVCMVIFLLVLFLTRYVSVSSMVLVVVFLAEMMICAHAGVLGIDPKYYMEFDLLAACFTAMAIFRHHANISRLIHGTENKFSIHPKKSEN